MSISRLRETARYLARFLNMKAGQEGGLDGTPSSSADMIFMSDALLFYFVPFYPGQQADIQILLADIFRILPDGLLSALSLMRHSI